MVGKLTVCLLEQPRRSKEGQPGGAGPKSRTGSTPCRDEASQQVFRSNAQSQFFDGRSTARQFALDQACAAYKRGLKLADNAALDFKFFGEFSCTCAAAPPAPFYRRRQRGRRPPAPFMFKSNGAPVPSPIPTAMASRCCR